MKIWYLSAYDQPHGHSSRTFDFAQELVKRGHAVTMFTNSYSHFTHVERLEEGETWRVEEIGGIRVVWLRTVHYHRNGFRRGLNMVSNAFRALMVSRVLSDRPDVVIGPSVPLGTGWAAARIAAAKRAAFVFEVRDVWPAALVDLGALSRGRPVYAALRSMEKSLYRKAQRISSVLPFLFDHVAASGSDPRKVTWIPNGVRLQRTAGWHAYDGDGGARPVVMYVGGFGYTHDVVTVIRAAAMLRNQGFADCRFVIVGNGAKRFHCEREADALGLTNVEFRDAVPKAEVPRILAEATILIAAVIESNVYQFGMNLNKIMDYFGSGRPVVFAGKSPNDPVGSAGAGFSIPPEDPAAMAEAIRKLLEMSPEERALLGRRGRLYVENNFDMSRLGERMERLLIEAVQANEGNDSGEELRESSLVTADSDGG